MTYQVSFTKEFKSGTLQGIKVPVSLTFASPKSAGMLAKRIRGGEEQRDCLTQDRWVASDVIVTRVR